MVLGDSPQTSKGIQKEENMKATYTSNTSEYELKNVMTVNFTCGILTIIYKDKDGDIKTTQYSAYSMPSEAQINIH